MHQWTILCSVSSVDRGGEGGSADRDGGGLRPWRHLAVGPAREGGEVGEHRRAPTFINLVVILGSGRRRLHLGEVGDPRPVDAPVEP